MALCEACGGFFDDGGEDWKTLCLRCWKAKKRAETANPDAVTYWQTRAIQAENRLFKIELSRDADPLPAGLRDHLKTLIFLCHPDKHGNDTRATAATQYLLSLREMLT